MALKDKKYLFLKMNIQRKQKTAQLQALSSLCVERRREKVNRPLG